MKVLMIVLVLSLLSYGITLTMSSSVSLARPNCDQKCGDVIIPYPFRVGSNCSANASFTIICSSKTPFLSSIKMEVVNISILGTVVVKQPVPSPMSCSPNMTTGHLSTSLKGSPFTISASFNKLAVLGCKNSVWLQADKTNIVGGFEKIWLANDYKSFKALDRGFGFVPLVLEWEFGELKGFSDSICTYAVIIASLILFGAHECRSPSDSVLQSYSADYEYQHVLYNEGFVYASSIKYCSCPDGYEGTQPEKKGKLSPPTPLDRTPPKP
ncbi:hypothetical protein SASPL_125667 [Salvia splendens]|uniref:Wall-associated receptor kinase galacturonan-binding domain-containing protein n=1 Tax=Salvia splendens TaxID=180675 RepID=A0A8X8XHJ5_SALSN|nr:hypothetical protein SASPL_125667 [Salvia splendens]